VERDEGLLVGRHGCHEGAAVVGLPASGEAHRQIEIRMDEEAVDEHALTGVVPQQETVELLHERPAIAGVRCARAALEVGGARRCESYALGRGGMAVEPAGASCRSRCLLVPLECGEEARHGGRVPAGERRQLHADAVCLPLLIPAIGREHQAARELPGPPDGVAERRAHDPGQHGGNPREHREGSGHRHAAHRMARRDVAYLVPQDVGEFVFLVDERQQTAGQIDVAAREREGVHVGAVDDVEVVREVLTR
jgi:hypothetical protein